MDDLNNINIQLDHAFVFCKPGALEANQLLEAGFFEAEPRTHAGQGTANRRFLFNNFMLEFLWVADEREIQNQTTTPTQLWQRSQWQDTRFCPFGLAFRARENYRQPDICPFPAWIYQPAYLPPTARIFIADNAPFPHEPMLFYTVFPQHKSHQKSKYLNPQSLTELTIQLSLSPTLSEAAKCVKQLTNLHFKENDLLCMHVVLNRHEKQITLDFRPALPLVLHY